VPNEWEIRDAFVQHPAGHKVIDLAESNLHVVSYSVGVDEQLSWEELKPFLHTLPEHPDWIPFRTAHFQSRWGFCLSHRCWQSLENNPPAAPFRVYIDAQQKPGHLEWGELLIPGQRPEEFLISTHICHPSLANDNLSGIVVATELARRLAAIPELPFSFRFLFIPATIGAITWLDQNRENLSRVCGGLVLANLGDQGAFTYKSSRQQTALIDQTVTSVLNRLAPAARIREFTPWGYDERQFCSPGFNLPMGRLTRTPDGEYPQYHTSADDLTFVQPNFLAESLQILSSIISEFARLLPQVPQPDIGSAVHPKPSSNRVTNSNSGSEVYLNLRPFGEPKLDRYGLYQGYGQAQDIAFKQAILWALSFSDGKHTFDDIAARSGLSISVLRRAVETLVECGLLIKTN
jgi:aminopeptidase-like protein